MPRSAVIGAIVGAALAAGGTFIATEAWDSFGWVPPEDHDHDIQAALEQSGEAVKAIKNFELKWECDEWLEELVEIGEKPVKTQKDITDIQQLSELVDEYDCHRFR